MQDLVIPRSLPKSVPETPNLPIMNGLGANVVQSVNGVV